MSIVTYGAATSVVSGRPSPKIWADCPIISFLKDPGKGFHVFEDFLEAPGASAISGARWYSTTTGGGTRVLTDNEKGILEITTDGGTNDEELVVSGNNTTGVITPANLSAKKWWFEARFAYGFVLATKLGMFLGLHQEGGATADAVLTDTSMAKVTTKDYVGFHAKLLAELDFVWNLNGQSAQSTNVIATMTTGTFYNVGFKYTPRDNKVHVYVDGVENISAGFLMSHASAPADTLAVTMALKAIAASTSGDSLDVDWVRYAAEY